MESHGQAVEHLINTPNIHVKDIVLGKIKFV